MSPVLYKTRSAPLVGRAGVRRFDFLGKMETVSKAKDGGESRRSSRLPQKVVIFIVALGICVGFSVCLELLRERVTELEAVVTRLSEVDKNGHGQGKTLFDLLLSKR